LMLSLSLLENSTRSFKKFVLFKVALQWLSNESLMNGISYFKMTSGLGLTGSMLL
jgi:hypothetical protein